MIVETLQSLTPR